MLGCKYSISVLLDYVACVKECMLEQKTVL